MQAVVIIFFMFWGSDGNETPIVADVRGCIIKSRCLIERINEMIHQMRPARLRLVYL